MPIVSRPMVAGASLVATNATELAAMSVDGMTVGTRCLVPGVGYFALTTSTAALATNQVVAVSGVTGARWILDVGVPGQVWTIPTGTTVKLAQSAGLQTSPVIMQGDVSGTNGGAAYDIGMDLARDPINTTTPGNNAGPMTIYHRISYTKDGTNAAMQVDAGDGALPNGDTGWAKAISMMLDLAQPVRIKNTGTPSAISRLASVYMTNCGIFVTDPAGSAINIPKAATLVLKGGPDTSDPKITFGARAAIWILGQPCWFDGGVELLDHFDISAAVGASPGTAPADTARFSYDRTAKGLVVGIDGATIPRPFPVVERFYRQFDPVAATFPVGDTVLKTYVASDASIKGLSGFDPRRWNLPAAIAISGGQLIPWVRFTVQSGSVTAFASVFLNATGSPVASQANSEFFGLDGWITTAEFLVRNTSSGTSTSQDLGLYQLEGIWM